MRESLIDHHHIHEGHQPQSITGVIFMIIALIATVLGFLAPALWLDEGSAIAASMEPHAQSEMMAE